MSRYFTPDEANAALLVIRPLMEQVMEVRQSLLEKRPELAAVLQKILGNGGSRTASEVAMEFGKLEDLIRRINATGAQFKDINSGLVDFLARHEGRDVYLCWRHGEDAVHYWHDIDRGFAGRQPL